MKAIELVENGVDEREFLYPYYRLQEAGFRVVVVGTKAGHEYRGKQGVTIRADAAASETNMSDYDVLVVPGGHAPDYMRRNPDMVRLVRQAFDQGKVVAAICHGPQLLIEADVVRGRRLTCFLSVKTDVKNAGGRYVDEEAVVDGNLVTSRRPEDLPAFMKATLAQAKAAVKPA